MFVFSTQTPNPLKQSIIDAFHATCKTGFSVNIRIPEGENKPVGKIFTSECGQQYRELPTLSVDGVNYVLYARVYRKTPNLLQKIIYRLRKSDNYKKGPFPFPVYSLNKFFMLGANDLCIIIYAHILNEPDSEFELEQFDVEDFSPIFADDSMSLYVTLSEGAIPLAPRNEIREDTLCEELLKAVYSSRGEYLPTEICVGVNDIAPRHFYGVLLEQVTEDTYTHVSKVFVTSQVSTGRERFCIYADFFRKEQEELIPVQNQREIRQIGGKRIYFKLHAYQDCLPNKIFELGTFKVSRIAYNENTCCNAYPDFLLFAKIPTEAPQD